MLPVPAELVVGIVVNDFQLSEGVWYRVSLCATHMPVSRAV